MISGIQFYENGMSNIMQNGGNEAKINGIPPQYNPFGMKMLADFTRRGIRVIDAFRQVPGVQARRSFPSEADQHMPRAELLFDQAALGLTRDAILERLLSGDPAVALAPSDAGGVFINPQTLRPGEEKIVVACLQNILLASK